MFYPRNFALNVNPYFRGNIQNIYPPFQMMNPQINPYLPQSNMYGYPEMCINNKNILFRNQNQYIHPR